ncbi:3D domain-containing protein [bacterium]|nr:3D domain-containing protein [bacterium]
MVKIVPKVSYSKYVTVTAYSSTVDQCDSTPFITANGTRVHDGIIAANFLRFGTKVRFPKYSGNKIYTVEDRMHQRFSNRADIWMITRKQAINFGAQRLKIEILEEIVE